MRRYLLLLLTVGCFGLSVPSAWAGFTAPTAHAAVSSFSTATIAAPTVTSAVRCGLSSTLVTGWTHSTSAFVTSQLVEVSTSSTMSPLTTSSTFNDNTTQAKTFSGLSSLVTYYVRVTAKYQSWSTVSNVYTSTLNALC